MRRPKRRNPIKGAIIDYINENSKIYAILVILFLIGLVLGIVFINNTNESEQTQISGYINNFIEALNDNQQISATSLLKTSIINDSITILILWFLGSTVIGMPLIYIAILYKGYSFGYAISSIIATLGTGKGLIFVLIVMLLPYVIYIPAILSAGVSGIKLHKIVIDDHRRENVKIQIIRHTLFCILMLLLLVIASAIETYMSIWLVTFLEHL